MLLMDPYPDRAMCPKHHHFKVRPDPVMPCPCPPPPPKMSGLPLSSSKVSCVDEVRRL